MNARFTPATSTAWVAELLKLHPDPEAREPLDEPDDVKVAAEVRCLAWGLGADGPEALDPLGSCRQTGRQPHNSDPCGLVSE